MGNKWLTALLIIVAIGIVAVVIFFRKPTENGIPALNAVPADAALVIKVNGTLPLLSAFDENSWWQGIPNTQLRSELNNLRQSFDSLCQENAFANDILNDSSVYFTVCGNVNEPVSILISIPFGTNITSDKVKQTLEGFCNASNCSSYEYILGKNVEQKADNKKLCWYYYIEKGLLVISNNLKNIDKSYHQLKRNSSLKNDTSFNKVFETSGKNVAANIFINNKQLPQIVSKWLKPEFSKSIRKNIETYGWSAVDYSIDNEFMAVHGFTVRGNENSLWMKILHVEQPSESSFLETVSKSNACYFSFAFSDAFNYKIALKEFLKANPHEKDKILNIRSKIGFEADNKIAEILGEAVLLVMEPNNDGQFDKYCIIKTQSNVDAIDFVNLCKKNSANAKPVKKNKIKALTDSVTIKTLYVPFVAGNLPEVLFGSAFEGKYTSVTNFNEYIIIGPSEKKLTNYIANLKEKKSIATDSLFVKTTSELLASKANISIVINTKRSWNSISNWFTDDAFSYFSNNLFNRNSKTLVGIQLSGNGDFIYNSGFIQTSTIDRTSSELVWKINTDTSITVAPVYFAKFNKNEGYIVFQDLNNVLFFVTSSGKIVWKKKLDGKILGRIHSIDYLKNNKNQLLFNTAQKLYLLDRNGKSLNGFPVTFKRKATNGLVVADFDNNLNYRYYLAFDNKSFVSLSKEGRKVEGWKFDKTKYRVNTSAKCFTFQGKDYIVFNDSLGVYLLNRKGEEKLKLKQSVAFSKQNELYIDIRPKYFRFILTDTAGQVNTIFPDGHVEQNKLGLFSSKHHFELVDFNADGQNNFLFTDDSLVYIFNSDNKVILSATIPGSINSYLVSKSAGSSSVFLASSLNNNVFKLNSDGNVAKGYPIKCNYSINFLSLSGNLNNRLLLVSGSKGVSSFTVK